MVTGKRRAIRDQGEGEKKRKEKGMGKTGEKGKYVNGDGLEDQYVSVRKNRRGKESREEGNGKKFCLVSLR